VRRFNTIVRMFNPKEPSHMAVGCDGPFEIARNRRKVVDSVGPTVVESVKP
jgi:hypothetical protein